MATLERPLVRKEKKKIANNEEQRSQSSENEAKSSTSTTTTTTTTSTIVPNELESLTIKSNGTTHDESISNSNVIENIKNKKNEEVEKEKLTVTSDLKTNLESTSTISKSIGETSTHSLVENSNNPIIASENEQNVNEKSQPKQIEKQKTETPSNIESKTIENHISEQSKLSTTNSSTEITQTQQNNQSQTTNLNTNNNNNHVGEISKATPVLLTQNPTPQHYSNLTNNNNNAVQQQTQPYTPMYANLNNTNNNNNNNNNVVISHNPFQHPQQTQQTQRQQPQQQTFQYSPTYAILPNQQQQQYPQQQQQYVYQTHQQQMSPQYQYNRNATAYPYQYQTHQQQMSPQFQYLPQQQVQMYPNPQQQMYLNQTNMNSRTQTQTQSRPSSQIETQTQTQTQTRPTSQVETQTQTQTQTQSRPASQVETKTETTSEIQSTEFAPSAPPEILGEKFSISIARICEATDAQNKKYKAYELFIVQDRFSWILVTRFTELFTLHKQLKALFPTFKFPTFPDKGILNFFQEVLFEGDFLEERKTQIESYLQFICSDTNVLSSAPMQAFLTTRKLLDPFEKLRYDLHLSRMANAYLRKIPINSDFASQENLNTKEAVKAQKSLNEHLGSHQFAIGAPHLYGYAVPETIALGGQEVFLESVVSHVCDTLNFFADLQLRLHSCSTFDTRLAVVQQNMSRFETEIPILLEEQKILQQYYDVREQLEKARYSEIQKQHQLRVQQKRNAASVFDIFDDSYEEDRKPVIVYEDQLDRYFKTLLHRLHLFFNWERYIKDKYIENAKENSRQAKISTANLFEEREKLKKTIETKLQDFGRQAHDLAMNLGAATSEQQTKKAQSDLANLHATVRQDLEVLINATQTHDELLQFQNSYLDRMQTILSMIESAQRGSFGSDAASQVRKFEARLFQLASKMDDLEVTNVKTTSHQKYQEEIVQLKKDLAAFRRQLKPEHQPLDGPVEDIQENLANLEHTFNNKVGASEEQQKKQEEKNDDMFSL